ncbi:MAG: flagellar motor switch phosphatase FliY [Spirochaetia bacterium]|jgi:flagellar motor switch protein FliN/FliY|nr:flagellar motor switch phosphatase FliY [Spirochaetia bacterium]
MSDGALSQDEIDALMSGSSTGGFDFGGGSGGTGDDLQENEKKAFLAVVNTLVDPQSATLSGMMGKTVTISPPSLEIVDGDSIPALFDENFVRVSAGFTDGVTGYHSYLLTPETAKAIAGLLTGLDQVELDDAALSAISEAINTISGAAVTAFGDKINSTIMTEPSSAELLDSSGSDLPSGSIVKLNYPISIEGYPQAILNELFEIQTVKTLASQEASQGAPDDIFAGMGQGMPAGNINQPPQGKGGAFSGQQQGGFGAQGQGGMGAGMGQKQGFVNIQNVQYPSLTSGHSNGEQGNISLLMDVNMEMTVELGRTKKPIREILSMGEGTIIELDKLAGEPVDILVNHKLIANGEVVVIDENFGVRVTKIVSNTSGISEMT